LCQWIYTLSIGSYSGNGEAKDFEELFLQLFQRKGDMMSDRRSIGIVGGGIAGLYCAWKLASNGYRVTLFERLHRLGGRIETFDLDGFKAECGPMRFELAIQPLFQQLAEEDLGIEFSPFAEPTGELAEFPRYILRDDEKSSAQVDAENASTANSDASQFSHLTSSFDLLKLGVYRIVQPDERELPLPKVVEPPEGQRVTVAEAARRLQTTENAIRNQIRRGRRSYDKQPNGRVYVHLTPPKITQYAMDNTSRSACARIRVRQPLEDRGPLLHTIGFWNALARVLSAGAINKIRDLGTFYHLIPENPSAAEHVIFWLRLFRYDAKLSTIRAGVDTVVNKLEEKIESANGTVKFGHTVTRLRPNEDTRQVRLTVKIDDNAPEELPEHFDHVILALPQWPLRLLAEFFPRHIKENIESVNGFPLLKAFVVTQQPWWDKNTPPHYGASLVPTRELHYWLGEGKNVGMGMVMLYTDRPACGYWQPYVVEKPHEKAQRNKSSALLDELIWHLYAAKMRDRVDKLRKERIENQRSDAELERAKRDLEQPDPTVIRDMKQSVTSWAIRDWSQPPFGAACHVWAPGVSVQDALENLKAFRLLEGTVRNVHVCGEAYSDYQGFIEGALSSSKSVLKTIDPTIDPGP
jgi:phytoene dehydrogenase-like protein